MVFIAINYTNFETEYIEILRISDEDIQIERNRYKEQEENNNEIS